MAKHVKNWSLSDVSEWLGNIGDAFKEYVPIFKTNGVDGSVLLQLDDVLIDELVKNKFHQKVILINIDKLKNKKNEAVVDEKEDEVHYIALYGTLRDDIPTDGKYGYRDKWIKDCVACDGTISGFQIYFSPRVVYPFAIKTNDASHTVTCRLVTWHNKQIFEEKLRHSDKIDHYNGPGEDNLFERSLVDAKRSDGKVVKAYMYYFENFQSDFRVIPSGDYKKHLKKNELAEEKLDNDLKLKFQPLSGDPLVFSTTERVKQWFNSLSINLNDGEGRAFYFSYGNDMSVSRLKKRIGALRSSSPAVLPKHVLMFNKKAYGHDSAGYANIQPHENGFVFGILHEVQADQLNHLDRHNGVKNGHYKRVVVKVLLQNIETVDAVTYIAGDSYIKSGLRPTREHLNNLLSLKDVLPHFYINILKQVPFVGSK